MSCGWSKVRHNATKHSSFLSFNECCDFLVVYSLPFGNLNLETIRANETRVSVSKLWFRFRLQEKNRQLYSAEMTRINFALEVTEMQDHFWLVKFDYFWFWVQFIASAKSSLDFSSTVNQAPRHLQTKTGIRSLQTWRSLSLNSSVLSRQ